MIRAADGRHDIPGAFPIKNESQGVGASRDGDRGIFRIGDAADLDFDVLAMTRLAPPNLHPAQFSNFGPRIVRL